MQMMQPYFSSKEHPSLCRLFLIPLSFLLLTVLVIYPNDLKLQSLFSSSTRQNKNHRPFFVGPVSAKPDFRILISVFTTAWTFERRHLLRLVYSKSAWPANNVTDHFDLHFVICNVTNEEHITTIALEIMHYGDITVLNCTENINEGKTYNYLSNLPVLFGHDRPYDYVMKTDDDTYLRLDALLESLRGKPRNDVYYGLEIPCNGTEFKFWIPTPFMTGLG
jgi:Galactosyltransferase